MDPFRDAQIDARRTADDVGQPTHDIDGQIDARVPERDVRQSVHPLDVVIARIASRQKGLVTHRQLRAAGIGRGAIELRLKTGRLHRVFRGVYLVGHDAMAPFARELAATLSYGPDALLSHSSGVALWQFLRKVPATIHVTVPGRPPGTQPGFSVHPKKPFPPADRTRLHCIPITTPARTLLDFAETHPDDRDLQRAWSEAQARRLITPHQIQRQLERSHGRHGAKAIAELLRRAMTQRSDSDLE